MNAIVFITHPEVVIDPAVPVPRWPLSPKGRARMNAFAEALEGRPVAAVWSSDEQKALEGGDILSRRLAAPHRVDPLLGENGRESTGYIAPPEFWEVVAEFFAKPDESVRGWETARHAQRRVVDAVERLNADSPPGVVLVVSHGGVGALLTAHLQAVEIGREDRPMNPSGGCYLTIDRCALALRQSWREIEDPAEALAAWEG